MTPHILSLLPPHDVYVEPFGGGMSVLLAKPPARIEVYNDIDDGLVNFWRVLREDAARERLLALLELTPYARAEFRDCAHTWREQPDPIEKARQWYVTISQSFSAMGAADKVGWSVSKENSHYNERLRSVLIDKRPAMECFKRFDRPDTLFYLDPPYHLATRVGMHGYSHEMDNDGHAAMLDAITHLSGMVVLSGYSHPSYEVALSSWERTEWSTRASSGNSRLHDNTRPPRTEVLWRNAACVAAKP